MAGQKKNGIFSDLKRLFSTDTIIRNIGGNQIKVLDIDKIQSYGNIETNSLYNQFNRLHSVSGTYSNTPLMNYQTLRAALYTDYEAMDTDAIISSALDVIADECTLKNEMGEILHIKSSDEKIQRILYNLFYDVLNIGFNLQPIVRSMCKYGDYYWHLQLAEKFGVYNAIPFNVYSVEREEGLDPNNPSYIRYKYEPNGSFGPTGAYGVKKYFEKYEMAHFRLIGDSMYLPYGKSYIEPARKIYKQLALMEDAMLIHRIMRAPEKRVFYLNTGLINAADVPNYMEDIKQHTKRVPYQDPNTGDFNLKFNMMNITEDLYIPLRGNDNITRIDTAKGLEYNAIEDITYLRDKLLSSLKIPKAYLGYEADLSGKATLASEDIRFARTIERIQGVIVSELTRVALVHLYLQGFEDEEITNFELSLTTPSIIYEQERIALLKEKVAVSQDMINTKLFPSDHIYHNVFQLSEDTYAEFRRLIVEDKKREFRYVQIENEGNDPVETGISLGTPHDLASLYGKGRYGVSDEKPEGYDEKQQGRPKSQVSDYGTQTSPFGKNPTGEHGLNPENGVPAGSSAAWMLENKKNTNAFYLNELRSISLFKDDKINMLDERLIKDI